MMPASPGHDQHGEHFNEDTSTDEHSPFDSRRFHRSDRPQYRQKTEAAGRSKLSPASLTRAVFAVMITVLIAVFILHPSFFYILQQAVPFLRHHLGAVPVERILEDEDTGLETREFLRQAGDIRTFAVHELGLSDTSNYTTYFALDRDFVAAVIQAAPEFSVEPYPFSYPIFGDMPYRGYYDAEAAEKKAKQLEKDGLDVYVRKVDAFSSLGFFSDPLFSFMKDYPPYRLAELIIHEQTHATVFTKNYSRFNEQLATFVGRKGSEQYIAETYGRDSSEYKTMMHRRHDAQLFKEDMAALAAELQELYSSGSEKDIMRKKKHQLLGAFRKRFSETYAGRYKTDNYAGVAETELDNAFVSLFTIYEMQNRFFEELYSRAGDIASMMRYLKQAPGLEEDPWAVKPTGD